MKKLKPFLSLAKKIGYPSSEVESLMKHMDYSSRMFIRDLQLELGEYETLVFAKKTLKKLENFNGSIKIPIRDFQDSWAAIKITNLILKRDDDYFKVDWFFSDSHIIDPETGETKTIEQIQSEADMGEWADVQDFIDYIMDDCSYYILKNTGLEVLID
jgi:hypothetical protein